ncbi:MAG: hypothetical protein P4M13_02035 [Alphaproteobacteria bacterium]|nr:hypothetical protein [Alphaproteobacteria bacterium]
MKELAKKRNPPETATAPKEPRAKPGRKSRKTKQSAVPAGSGGTLLRNSIDHKVGEHFEEIAQALVNKAVAGNMTGTHIVVKVTGADKAPAEIKKARGPQPWVTNICNEPELPGPWDEQRKRDASLLPLSDYDLPDDLK